MTPLVDPLLWPTSTKALLREGFLRRLVEIGLLLQRKLHLFLCLGQGWSQ